MLRAYNSTLERQLASALGGAQTRRAGHRARIDELASRASFPALEAYLVEHGMLVLVGRRLLEVTDVARALPLKGPLPGEPICGELEARVSSAPASVAIRRSAVLPVARARAQSPATIAPDVGRASASRLRPFHNRVVADGSGRRMGASSTLARHEDRR